MVIRFFNYINLEEVVILQYETSTSIQYFHLRLDCIPHTCLSKSQDVCDLWEAGYSNLQYGGDEEG